MPTTINTVNGAPFVVDDDDSREPRMVWFKDGTCLEVVIKTSRWRWVGTSSKRHVATQAGRKLVYVHRAVMQSPPSFQVDHVDGNTANNVRSNLRLATHGENVVNQQKPRNRASSYRGVRVKLFAFGLRYFATVKKLGRQYRTPLRKDELQAARDYDQLASSLHGEFAVLNFPRSVEPCH